MDFSFALTSKRVAAVVIPPLVGWGLTKWPAAMGTVQTVCAAFSDDPAVTSCTPADAKTFLISNLTLLTIAIVALAFQHGKLTFSFAKAKPPADSQDSGDANAITPAPKA